MKLAKLVSWSCAAALLALAAVQVKAQGQSPAKVEPPTVPDVVAAAYRWGDFAELERLYAAYGKAGVRSELTGIPHVAHFWKGVGRVNDSTLKVTEDYYLQLDALTNQWAREHPRSVPAQLLYAATLMAHASVYRGGGYADTVSPAAWAGFRKYLDLALAQLQRTEAMAANDSSWNALMLGIGRSLGWDKQDLLAVFEAGIAKNPDHDDLYFAMQEALLPKWGGDLEMVDRFIALAVKRTREKRGMEMYARLYAGLSYGQVNQALFSSTRASWPSMRTGFEDLLKRYPHADHRNMYAYFACMADDRPILREQLELIGDKFNPIFWGGNAERNFEMCKTLAQQI
jgi:hypothetical protein